MGLMFVSPVPVRIRPPSLTLIVAVLSDMEIPPTVNLAQPVTGRAVHVVDRPGAPQSTIYVGLPTIDPSHEDYIALQVANTLLGGSFGSRITSNIREDKGYTYSPTSTLSTRYRDAYWAEVADVTSLSAFIMVSMILSANAHGGSVSSCLMRSPGS